MQHACSLELGRSSRTSTARAWLLHVHHMPTNGRATEGKDARWPCRVLGRGGEGGRDGNKARVCRRCASTVIVVQKTGLDWLCRVVPLLLERSTQYETDNNAYKRTYTYTRTGHHHRHTPFAPLPPTTLRAFPSLSKWQGPRCPRPAWPRGLKALCTQTNKHRRASSARSRTLYNATPPQTWPASWTSRRASIYTAPFRVGRIGSAKDEQPA